MRESVQTVWWVDRSESESKARSASRGRALRTGRISRVAALQTRRASLADLDLLLAHVQAGFNSYVAFAPRLASALGRAGSRVDSCAPLRPDTWALLALVAGRPAGHVAFFPARERTPDDGRHWSERPKTPGLAHLWQLFVLREWWGRGVAPALHDAAVAEMRMRKFEQARLYTPSAHARAAFLRAARLGRCTRALERRPAPAANRVPADSNLTVRAVLRGASTCLTRARGESYPPGATASKTMCSVKPRPSTCQA